MVCSLEPSVAKLGASVYKLKTDLIKSSLLAAGKEQLLGFKAASLHRDEVLFDLSIVGETTHWAVLGSGVILNIRKF